MSKIAKRIRDNLLIILLQLIYYIRLLKFALSYFLILLFLFFIVAILGNIDLTPEKFTLFLTLNYNPTNIAETIAQIIMFLIQTSPIMAFVEVRTLTYEEKAVLKAQRMRNHIIVIGLGHLGKRVVKVLKELEIPFVLVTLSDVKDSDVVNELIADDIPVIFGDATSRNILKSAGIENARAVIISINNDTINPIIAERAKEINPNVKVIARVYWDEIANLLLKSKFADEVLSTTALSVAKYIVGCYHDIATEIPPPIPLRINKNSPIITMTPETFEEKTSLNILAIIRENKLLRDTKSFKEGDVLIVWGEISSLKSLFSIIE